jgi:hypothetical protein
LLFQLSSLLMSSGHKMEQLPQALQNLVLLTWDEMKSTKFSCNLPSMQTSISWEP